MMRMNRRRYLAMMTAAAGAALESGICLGEAKTVLRLAISVETLAGANINDARAAYQVWLREVALQYGSQTAEPVPEIFISSEEIVREIRQGTIDAYGVTALELVKVAELTEPNSLVIQEYQAVGLEYVLLVHYASSIRKIGDLKDAHILSHHHRDMVLLPAWLGTMLAANKLPAPDRFFASHHLNDSLNQVVLPVFFRSADAACVARRSWETAVELNPQLGRDLRVLAVSPRVVPNAFGFRRTTSANARKELIDAIQRIESVPAGQQIVALYQSHSFAVKPISVMKSTFDMVHQYERLSAQPSASRKGPE